MTIIEQINDLKSKQKIIEYRIEEIDSLYQKLIAPKAISYDKDSVMSSPQDLLAKNIADLIDKQVELSRIMIEQQNKLDVFMEDLNSLKPEDREVMFLRMKGLSYRKIAEDVYRCKDTVRRIVKRVESEHGEPI